MINYDTTLPNPKQVILNLEKVGASQRIARGLLQHNPTACTVCGLPVTHPIHTLGGTK